MTLVGAGLAGSTVALVAAAAISGLVSWSGPVDRPRDRGSHHLPTPTAGGLGIIAGADLGLLVFALLTPAASGGLAPDRRRVGFRLSAGACGGLG